MILRNGVSEELLDLTKYKPHAEDKTTVGWVVDHTPPDYEKGIKDITFKIEAHYVLETEDGRAARLIWEKMHQSVRRQERRLQREERESNRKHMEKGGGIEKDEL
jgi:hypothetical protein